MRRERAVSPSKKKRVLDFIITSFFIGLFLYSAIHLGSYLIDHFENKKVIEEAKDLYHATIASSAGDNREQFQPLLAINSDIIGWIKIDGTNIDYPILQAKDNEYYLEQNYQHENNRAGSIFMDYRNDIAGEEKNFILYGHRMKNGTMFADLKKWLDGDIFAENPEIVFETLNKSYQVEVFSVYRTTTDFNYIQTDFSSDEDYANFLKTLQEKSLYPTGLELTADSTILTLSTCDYSLDSDEGRLVVHAIITENREGRLH
ncbi:class B sortase [Robertmurraya massiliosenegalensis]|uniref:class B sortase n=1 Tax=Robertmurraya TaxID=2837507 RepID=UPI0039A70453